VLGKGSFGKVLLVKKKSGKDAGSLYALKTLRKEVLIKRNQLAHTKTERSVLQRVDFPFLVTLRYAWQVSFVLVAS
jgi:serine/threonine protein kinase